MTERRYLVLDIETVTDWELVRLVTGLAENATTDELREALNQRYSRGFPPPPFHVPVCISLIDVDYESCKVLNAMVLDAPDERTLLQQFWRVVRFRKGTLPVETILIHFNGRSFDLPVLFYRSMKHRAPIVQWDRKRFSFDSSHDICDDLGDFGATSKPSLDVIAKMIGLPGKQDVDGSQVEELYNRGERARIKDYCMDDAVATYQIWLTIKLIRGELTDEKYREAFDSASELVKACRLRTENFKPQENSTSPVEEAITEATESMHSPGRE
jgi:predicted PolB exonuclease-like 3'-5' exonuclease